jgi:hypothetical protein
MYNKLKSFLKITNFFRFYNNSFKNANFFKIMSGSGGVLSLFPSLSDRNVTKRVSSAKEFVSQLTNEEIEEEKKEKDIDYCIERFVKGLAANKGEDFSCCLFENK